MTTSQDLEFFLKIQRAVEKRAPAMVLGKTMGALPSFEEALFLSNLVEDETKKLGLPEFWYSKQILDYVDRVEATTKPYKCGECGQRWETSDKRARCHPISPTK